MAQQVIDLTNAQRKQNGLPALQADTQLSNVAQTKSDDMRKNGYFSHTSPTYGSPFDMMRDFGVSYRTAGENIAQGQRSAQEVVNAWMNSEGHRKNILSKDFTHIGVGYDSSGHHWTQMFIGKITSKNNTSLTNFINDEVFSLLLFRHSHISLPFIK